MVIANHLVAFALWYILTLVATNPRRLHQLSQILVAFIWSKEGWVSKHKCPEWLLTLAKRFGGLGLVDVALQAKILCLYVFLWALELGFHPLQRLIKHESCRVALTHYGSKTLVGLLDDHCSTSHKNFEVMGNLQGVGFFQVNTYHSSTLCPRFFDGGDLGRRSCHHQ